MPDQSVVRVDTHLLDEVQTYCRITGISLTTVLNEAVAAWIEGGRLHSRLEPILKQVQERVAAKGSKARLSLREQELLARYLPQNDLAEGEEPHNAIHLHNNDPVPMEWRVAKIYASGSRAKTLSPNPGTGIGSTFAATGGEFTTEDLK
jgi:hypothetical protein